MLRERERERHTHTQRNMERGGGGKGVETVTEEKRQGLMFFVGKRGGPSTPPPIWRLEFPSQAQHNNGHPKIPLQEFLNFPTSSSLSARKLCAKLWETQPHHVSPLPKMTRLRRRHHRKDTVPKVPKQFAEPPDSPYDQV